MKRCYLWDLCTWLEPLLYFLLLIPYVGSVDKKDALIEPLQVPKCCPLGESYAIVNDSWGCFSNAKNYTWDLKFYHQKAPNESPVSLNGNFPYKLIPWKPNCTLFNLDPDFYPDDKFYILSSGAIYVPEYVGLASAPANGLYWPEMYCIDDNEVDDDAAYPGPYVFVCFPDPPASNPVPFILYPIGFILSDIFLLLTFLVYVILPDMRNLFGKTLICHVTSLFVAYLLLTIIQLSGATALSSSLCQGIGIIMHFAFFSAFSWLTVMCYDMWLKIRQQLPPQDYGQNNRQFLIYCLCAWGGPFLYVSLAVVINYAPGMPTAFVKPKYGIETCWLGGNLENILYFYGPMAILLLFNMIFFVSTTCTIWKVKQETGLIFRNPGNDRRVLQRSRQEQQRFILYFKLFLVMGIFWTMEVVSWVCQKIGKSPDYFWYATDFINTLQGIVIFFVSVCKIKTWRKVRIRVGCLFGGVHSARPVRFVDGSSGSSSPASSISSMTSRITTLSIRATDSTEAGNKLEKSSALNFVPAANYTIK